MHIIKSIPKYLAYSFLLILIIILGSFFVRGALDDANVIASWNMNQVSGTNVFDNVSQLYNLTTNADWSAGKSNNSLKFVSSDTAILPNTSLMRFTNGAGTDYSFSLSYWVNHTSLTDYQSHFAKWASGEEEYYEITYATGQIGVSLNKLNPNYIGRKTNTGALTTNTWYHIVITYNGSKTNAGIKIYVNGAQADTTDFSAGTYTGMVAGSTPFNIGARNGSLMMLGSIDEFVVFNYSLNSSQIAELYNSGAGKFFPFNATTPSVDYTPVFYNQSPSDITSTNMFGQRINISYLYNDLNISNTSSIILNFSVTNAINIINGTSYTTLSTINYTYKQTNLTLSSDLYSFLLGDNNILPGVYAINETIMENTIHNSSTLNNANNLLKMKLTGVNSSKLYNYFEIMMNTTGNNNIYYCNSTYTTGNPATSSNCAQFGTLNVSTFNHTHTGGNSSHNLFNFPINNTGFISGVKVTSTSYFIVKGTNTGASNYYYIENQTDTAQTQLSTNNGATYTTLTNNIVDFHIHQFNANENNFTYNACYTNNSGTTLCSGSRSDNLDISPLPPTAPAITSPTAQRYKFTENMNITWTASVPFNSSVTITSYNISLLNNDLTFNKTINSSTTALSQLNYNITNLSGSHYIKVEAKDSLNQTSFSISEQFNVTGSITLGVKNAWTGLFIGNFTGWLYNSNTGENRTINSTSNTTNILLDPGLNMFFVENEIYSISSYNYYNLTTTSVLQNYNYNISIYSNNSVLINIFDEADSSPILQNISIELQQSNLTLATYYTSNGTYFLQDLADGLYTFVIGGTTGVNYTDRSYDVTVASRSTQTLNAYLINSGLTITTLVLDSLNFGVIETASVSQYRSINNSWTLVQVKSTDITGRALFYYLANTKYKFIVQKTGYGTKEFELDPVIYDTYSIYLVKNVVYNYTGDFEDVKVTFSPWQYFANKVNNFVFVITSPNGTLENYGVNISYPCGNFSYTGNNSQGQSIATSFNITCANYTDKINITYYYDTVYSSRKDFRVSFYISGATTGSNYTFANLRDNHYGLGDLERILIVTFFVLILAGVTYAVMGGTPALIVGLLIFGYFTYTGFIEIWFTLLSTVIGVLVWFGGRER